jgi:DNA invertase Pin-like site-specific DNA recombinase
MRTAMRQMVGVFGQLERAMIVARLRRGRQMKASLGGRAVGAAPYGFRPEGGELVPRHEEQRAIQVMSNARAAGKSFREVAEVLNQRGLPPRRGQQWHAMTVRRILDRAAT